MKFYKVFFITFFIILVSASPVICIETVKLAPKKTEQYVDPAIGTLLNKTFWIKEEANKITFIKSPLKNGMNCDEARALFEKNGTIGKKFINNTASLPYAKHAVSLPETARILAFLMYEPGCFDETSYIITVFDKNNLDKPICFQKDDRFGGTDYGIKSIDARKAKTSGHFFVVNYGGGDIVYNNYFDFYFINDTCDIIFLYHADVEAEIDGSKGTKLSYKFVDDHTVKITSIKFEQGHYEQGKLVITKSLKPSTKTIDLDKLLINANQKKKLKH